MIIKISTIYNSDYYRDNNLDVLKNQKLFEEYRLVNQKNERKLIFQNCNYNKKLRVFLLKKFLPYFIFLVFLSLLPIEGSLIPILLLASLIFYHIIIPDLHKLNKRIEFSPLEVVRYNLFGIKNNSFYLNRVINYSKSNYHYIALLPYNTGKSMIILLENDSKNSSLFLTHNKLKSNFFLAFFNIRTPSIKGYLLINLLEDLLKSTPDSKESNYVEVDYKEDVKSLINRIFSYHYDENEKSIPEAISINNDLSKAKINKVQLETFIVKNRNKYLH